MMSVIAHQSADRPTGCALGKCPTTHSISGKPYHACIGRQRAKKGEYHKGLYILLSNYIIYNIYIITIITLLLFIFILLFFFSEIFIFSNFFNENDFHFYLYFFVFQMWLSWLSYDKKPILALIFQGLKT